MSSPKSPKTAFSKLGLSRPKPIRILVLGQDGVGKSALVVRYLTRRFIGEYDPNLEKIYPFSASVDSETVFMEILDSAGLSNEVMWEVPVLLIGNKKDISGDRMISTAEGIKRSQDIGCVAFHEISVRESIEEESDCVRLEANIRWADVFLLMYSVADKCSFDECNRLKFLINYNKRKRKLASPTSKEVMWEVPVLLIGNKKDISGDRMISTAEGIKRSQDIGCVAFHEISVRESIEEVTNVFNDAIKFWRDVYKSPKIRRASSELPGAEYYQSLHEAAKGNSTQHMPISGNSGIRSKSWRFRYERFDCRARTNPV